MSRLDRGNVTVTVFPEVAGTDPDGNPTREPSTVGREMRVFINPLPQSGTSARRAEQDNEGFETEQLYRLRFRRKDDFSDIGPRGYLIWNNQKWQFFGHPINFNGGPRTAHSDFTIKRT